MAFTRSVYVIKNALVDLGINEHQKVDQDSVHNRVKQKEGSPFHAKEFTRDGVNLRRGNDEKQKSSL